MSRIENFKGPMGLKPDKPAKAPRKGMRRVAKGKRSKERKSATGPMVDEVYANHVRSLSCATCGKAGPSDIHHCKDRPPADLRVYRYFPGYAETSADFDGIPLCKFGGCHDLYHRNKGEFHRRFGPDYQHIPSTRAAVAAQTAEIGF